MMNIPPSCGEFAPTRTEFRGGELIALAVDIIEGPTNVKKLSKGDVGIVAWNARDAFWYAAFPCGEDMLYRLRLEVKGITQPVETTSPVGWDSFGPDSKAESKIFKITEDHFKVLDKNNFDDASAIAGFVLSYDEWVKKIEIKPRY